MITRSSLATHLHSTTLYLFYFLFITTPLVWYPDLSELFEFPKMVFVYIVTTLIVGVWVARMITQGQVLIRKSFFDIPIALFLSSQIISTLLSIHPHTSFLGYYSRFHGGLLSTLTYITLYYAYISNFNRSQSLRSLAALLIGALLASLYALPEHFGFSPSCLAVTGKFTVNCWIQDVQNRIFGTFGQPNWLAAFLISLLPIAWGIVFLKPKNLSPTSRIPYYLLPPTLFLTLLFTRSRSGFIGFVISFLIFFFLFILTKLKPLPSTPSTHPSVRKSLLTLLTPSLTIISSLLLVAVIFGTEYSPSLSNLISRLQSSPTATSSASPAPLQIGTVLETGGLSLKPLDQGGTESGDIRKIVWQGAIDVFRHHPLFGSGVETFAYSYYNHRPAAHNLVSEWDFLYNKAHNEFLNFLATTGIYGFLTYLILIFSFIFFILRWLLLPPPSLSDLSHHTSTQILLISLLSGYIALAVSNFFGFSTVAVGLIFFIFPAMALTLTQTTLPLLPSTPTPTIPLSRKQQKHLQSQGVNPSPSSLLSTTQSIFLIISLLVTCYLLLLSANYLRADYHYNQGLTLSKSNLFNQSLQQFQQALELNPNEAVIRNDFSNTLSKAAAVQAYNGNNAETVRLAQLAFQESAHTLRLNPVHINIYKTLAGVYIRLSDFDPTLLEVAKVILQDARLLAPTDAKLSYNLGLIELDQLATPSAQLLFEHTIELKPNYEDARIKLAEVYTQTEEYHKAIDQYRFVLEFIAPKNTNAQQELERLTSLLK